LFIIIYKKLIIKSKLSKVMPTDKKKEKKNYSMVSNMMTRGSIWRNLSFVKVVHAASKAPTATDPDEGELDVGDLSSVRAPVVARKILSKPKI
jgi:hypothetical protein